MRYKALFIDVDGTLVSVREKAMPSKVVIDALQKASKDLSVHLITARPLTETHNLPTLFKTLPFLSDSVINGGAQIVNPRTHKIISNKAMRGPHSLLANELLGLCEEVVAITSENKSFNLDKIPSSEKVIKIVAVGVGNKNASSLMKNLKKIKNIVAYQTTSYKKGSDIIITHKNATKEKAIKTLMKKYKLLKEEIIGVGDTTHDLSFILQCGVRVAMGNAQEELKEVADFIAPSVDEDGLAAVVAKYI